MWSLLPCWHGWEGGAGPQGRTHRHRGAMWRCCGKGVVWSMSAALCEQCHCREAKDTSTPAAQQSTTRHKHREGGRDAHFDTHFYPPTHSLTFPSHFPSSQQTSITASICASSVTHTKVLLSNCTPRIGSAEQNRHWAKMAKSQLCSAWWHCRGAAGACCCRSIRALPPQCIDA